jgi:hypothetical protein
MVLKSNYRISIDGVAKERLLYCSLIETSPLGKYGDIYDTIFAVVKGSRG